MSIPVARLKSYFSFSIVTVGLLLLAGFAFDNWHVIVDKFQSSSPELLLFGVCVTLLLYVVYGYYFYLILEKYHLKVGCGRVIDVFLSSQIAKYIPGKIWGITYQITRLADNNTYKIDDQDVNKNPVSQKLIPLSFTLFMANIEIMIGGLCIIFFSALSTFFFIKTPLLSCVTLILGLFVFNFIHISKANNKIINLFFKKINKDSCIYIYKEFNNIFFGQLTRVSILYFSQIALTLVSHYLLINAFFTVSHEQILSLISIHLLSVIIGIITVVSPSGVGVRELSFIFFSEYFNISLSSGELVAMALLMRLAQIFVDALAFFVAIIFIGSNKE